MTDVFLEPRPGSSAAFDRAWRAQARFWHMAFVALWAIALVLVLIGQSQRPLPMVGCLLGIALAYVLLGVRALERTRSRWGLAYVAVCWTVVCVMQYLDPPANTWILYFILFPQMWAVVRAQVAFVTTVVVLLVVGAIQWFHYSGDAASRAETVISTLMSMTLSLVLGMFINRMIREAQSRAQIIDELHHAHARLVSVERERGVHEERDRLSREIHDTLAQGYTSVLALSRAASSALGRGDLDAVRERLALMESTAADNLSEARLIVAELSPGHLQSRTLEQALDRLVGAVRAETRLDAVLIVLGTPASLGGDREVVLLRAAQEALSNVRRHAGASAVTVSLDYDHPRRVVLTVVDDGVGFEDTPRRRGFGLDGVRSRARAVGGRAEIASRPGEGTTVLVEVPR